MQYRDLPSKDTVQRLMATSFSSPSQNKKVFDWCNAILPLITFVENERRKLIEKYGEDNAGTIKVKDCNIAKFFKDFSLILDMNIEEKLPILPLDENSFEDYNCCYSREKEFWLNPKEISILMKIKKKQED